MHMYIYIYIYICIYVYWSRRTVREVVLATPAAAGSHPVLAVSAKKQV